MTADHHVVVDPAARALLLDLGIGATSPESELSAAEIAFLLGRCTLDLHGPSVTVRIACSSTLAALQLP